MPTSEKVSVLIPSNKVDHYLDQAIASVLADGHPDIEVVLCLDGLSPDRAPDAASDPRVRVTATEAPSGAAAALNQAAELATGTYMARLDADDISLPGRFSAQAEVLAARPDVQLVATEAVLIDDQGARIGAYPTASDHPREQLLHTNPLVHSSIMVRLEDFRAAGGYNTSMIRMQDYDLILRLALRGDVVVLADRLVGYRIHGGQNSGHAVSAMDSLNTIGRDRFALARLLGHPVLAQQLSNLAWTAAQLLRYSALRSPRYLKGRGETAGA